MRFSTLDALRTDLDELKLEFQSFLDGHLGEGKGPRGAAPFSCGHLRAGLSKGGDSFA